MWLAAIASLAAAGAADCPQTTSLAQLRTAISSAETAYAAVDLRAFEAAVESARAALPCIAEVVPPSTAASLHRAEGLSAFVASDSERARTAFGAARRIEPAFAFPEELVPEDNPVLALYAGFDLSKATALDIPAPPEGSLRVDGRPTRIRVPEVPQVVQWVDPAGAPRLTSYLWPGDPLPRWPVPGAAPVSHRRRTFAIGSAIGVGVAGGLYGAAAAVHATWQDPATDVSRVDGLRTATNGLVLGSATALAAALGLGAASLAASP
jgi:hypothetical protein